IFTKMITKVKSASVSTNTKPRIIAARIAAAAPGLRAMPSQAAEAMRPCPSAPPKAASAMPKPAAMANRPLPPAAAAPVSCANADGAINITAANATNTIIHFFITSSLSSQGLQVQTLKPDELPPGGGSRTPCSRAHTEAANCRHKFTGKARLVLVGRSHAQINRGQHRKDIGLNDGHKDMQADKAMGIVAGSTAITMPKIGDFDQAATVAMEKRLRKIEYRRSLATMLAQRRTVRERMRAEVLTISTGKSRIANAQSPNFLGEPANVSR